MVIRGKKLTRQERCRIAKGKDIELLIELIANEVDPFVKEELAVNLAIPMNYRLELLKDVHAAIRNRTIKNLNMPREFFEHIALHDDSIIVRNTAKKIIEERFLKIEEKIPNEGTPLIITV